MRTQGLVIFLGLTAIFFLSGLWVYTTSTKGVLVLFFNQWHGTYSNLFFQNLSFLGEGIVMVALVLVLAWKKIRDGLMLLVAWLLTGAFTQLLKRGVFSEFPRPAKYFENMEELSLVPGVKVSHWLSFPSGHTSTAFAMFLVLAVVFRKSWIGAVMFLLAAGVGISRIYLVQHFLEDVLAGAVLGAMVGGMVVYFFQTNAAVQQVAWLNRSLKSLKDRA